MIKLYVSPAAKNDLIDIKQYITDELKNPIAADRVIVKITNRIKDLISFPEMGARLSCKMEIDNDYRFIVCNSYLAFYRIENNSVYIDRIIYGRRDYISILFGNLDNEAE